MGQSHRASSLIELLITITIFALVATAASVGMANTMRSAKKIQSQVYLYTEAETLMDQLAREVEQRAIDYEAYYARNVLLEDGWHTEAYGLYAMTFYDPGTTTGGSGIGPYGGLTGYGAYCDTAVPGDGDYPDDCPDTLPDYSELDSDTGTHPFPDIALLTFGYTDDEDKMNAFCEWDGSASDECDGIDHFITDELILINGDGDERIVFARESFNEGADFSMSEMELTGTDTDNDGIVDSWACDSGYECSEDFDGDDVPIAEDFMPITPTAISVANFYLYVTPNEDPYRAFYESGAQIQPQVTLVLTVTLSEDYSDGLLGEVPTITLQRTVSTGVYGEVVSYE